MFLCFEKWQGSLFKTIFSVALSLASFLPLAPASRADGATVLRDGWKIQSSAKISGGGEQISTVGFSTEGWYSTSVPKTVFAALVENGVYKNPYFGMNLRSIPGIDYKVGGQFANEEMSASSPYAVSWWYRKEFEVPLSDKYKRVWLAFRGINYRADLWINGKKLAGSDAVAGAFRRYEFDVTDFVRPGAKNAVAVEVSAPHAGELGITWVDWNPTPPDKDMGLWQEVVLSTSGPMSIRHSTLETKLQLPGADIAHLTVRTEVANATSSPIHGELRGSLAGQGDAIKFSLQLDLAPNEKKEIAFAPESFPSLNLLKPKLWWPYQMGEPHLNRLKLEFIGPNSVVSDSQELSVGIIQTDSELTPEGYRLLKINGKPILIRGGGWAPDMMLRVDESRREAEFRYVKEMGLNTIRLEGKLEDESFMERADRDGILIMAGWCCCDAWEKWGKWNEETKQVSVSSLRDQMVRLRSHPSLLMWLNGSDNPPPPEREMAYLEVAKETRWPKPIISSATARETDITGKSGVKMSGPYEYVPANYWIIDTKAGGAYGFNTETSPGPAVPPVEDLKSFIPEDKLWPINDVWNFHAGGGQFKNINVFTNALEKRYGEAKNVQDFAWKPQAMAYEGERAMFEAYGRNKYKSTGIIQWMLNNAWPGLIWHLYSYDLRPAGGYFGSKKALELVHVQFSHDDHMVAVVNGTQTPQNGLRVVAKVYDATMNERFSREGNVDVVADGVAHSFAIPETSDISATYLPNLQLFKSAGQLVSRNFYWLSTQPDVLNFDKTEWYYTPQTAYADFSALQTLPSASVKASWKALPASGNDAAYRVTVENTGKGLAFLLRLRLVKGKNASEILPVFWEANYISLVPGERCEIEVRVRKSDLGAAHPALIVDGFNLAPVKVRMSN